MIAVREDLARKANTPLPPVRNTDEPVRPAPPSPTSAGKMPAQEPRQTPATLLTTQELAAQKHAMDQHQQAVRPSVGTDPPSGECQHQPASSPAGAATASKKFESHDSATASKVQGVETKIDGSATADLPLRYFAPVSRHTLRKVNQKSFVKEVTTVIEGRVDVGSDVGSINAGNAVVGGNSEGIRTFTVNGGTYGAKPNGTLYSIEGPGFHRLSRGGYKALGVLNQFGDTKHALDILLRMHDVAEPDIMSARSAWKAEQ